MAAELSESDLIAQAFHDLHEFGVVTVLDACEAYYGHGFSDEQCGTVDYGPGHFYRVARWIVQTDSQGFHYLHEYPSESEAMAAFAQVEADCDAAEGED